MKISVNQLAAKIKLIEVWKSVHSEGYPLSLEPYKVNSTVISHDLRFQPNRVFNDNCRLQKSESSYHIDAARIWNAAPLSIRNAISLNIAESKIDKFCDTLLV